MGLGQSDSLTSEEVPLARWEGCTADELQAAWRVPGVHIFAAVGSTNDIARRLGDTGAPDGTLVLAETQRKGRGRAGRSWASPEGLGLWVSILHRPLRLSDVAPLPLRVALAVASALDPWCESDDIGIKWPNDLLLSGRKLGGILCEATWDAGELRHVVIGIGLNLLHGPEDFPPELRDEAISVRAFTGEPVGRFEVASELIRSLRDALQRTDVPLPGDLAGRDVLRGRHVQVLEPESGRRITSGFAAGVAPDGALRLNTSAGMIEVRSGTIRIAEPD